MKKTICACIIAALAPSAHAACYGSGSFQTCSDASGNSYNVTRYGNTAHLDGYSAGGSSWSQNSSTIGNTTYHDGYSADGGAWNGTSTTIGNTTFHSGTDSDGSYYQSTCNQFGCY